VTEASEKNAGGAAGGAPRLREGTNIRITLTTHGGFAGALQRKPTVVDCDSLPPAAVEEARSLVAAAERAAAQRGGKGAVKRMPDAQSYVVDVVDGPRSLALTGSDLASDAEFDALHDWILRHAPA
jgi:hypothetical protein